MAQDYSVGACPGHPHAVAQQSFRHSIGLFLSKCFLTEYRSAFPTVRVTTRNVDSPASRELAALGAEIYSFQDSLTNVLDGADVVVNALPTHVSEEDKKKATAAVAATSSVKVYFMSEFGV